ncbi:hypothetical protein [Kutzneria kofuensis]|uniref:Uncharacterized protein n=1 Tax=Kutzneria kofuensis TaxID=103725 RepID=A0A7W9KC97_9PSEU|nr:hypothetical protein [Kutzneria kofuensis]
MIVEPGPASKPTTEAWSTAAGNTTITLKDGSTRSVSGQSLFH